MTGTLEKLDLLEGEDDQAQDLLATIRCPRNLGMITDRLPASQYHGLKRSKSMAIAPIKKVDTERKHNVTKSIENFEPKKLQSEQKQKRRHIGNLPTIQEDNVDDEIVDCSKLGLIKKKTSDKKVPKSVRQSLNSDRVEKDIIKPKHGRYNSNIHLMQDVRSADILS